MRKGGILILFALIMIIQGAYAWWAAAVRGIEPIIMSFGAAIAAIGLNNHSNHDEQLFKSKDWFKIKSEVEKPKEGNLFEEEEGEEIAKEGWEKVDNEDEVLKEKYSREWNKEWKKKEKIKEEKIKEVTLSENEKFEKKMDKYWEDLKKEAKEQKIKD